MKIEYISASPFDDYAIKQYINNNGVLKNCNWTGRKDKCVHYSELTKFINERIQTEYVKPTKIALKMHKNSSFFMDSNQRKVVQSSLDLLYDLLAETPFEILQQIAAGLSEEYWTRKEFTISELNENYIKSWEEFRQIIKHKIRFMFFNEFKKSESPTYEKYTDPYSILIKFREAILKYGLVTTYNKQELLIYRARQHKKQKDKLNLEQLGPPPCEYAQSNRLSPAGISMFYCALEEATAIIEVIDINQPDYCITTAHFTNLQPLKIIDFTRLIQNSIFDIENIENRKTYILLSQFIEDLSRPISNDGSQHIDYVPTQVVTEFLKNSFKTNNNEEIHGLLYPSTKRNGHKNIVLFFNLDNITGQPKQFDSYILFQPNSISNYQVNELNFSIQKTIK